MTGGGSHSPRMRRVLCGEVGRCRVVLDHNRSRRVKHAIRRQRRQERIEAALTVDDEHGRAQVPQRDRRHGRDRVRTGMSTAGRRGPQASAAARVRPVEGEGGRVGKLLYRLLLV